MCWLKSNMKDPSRSSLNSAKLLVLSRAFKTHFISIMKAQKELHHNFSSVLKKKLIEKMLSHGHRVLKFVRLTMLKKNHISA